MIDITGFVFILILGFCLFLDWLDGDLYWDRDTFTLSSRKVDREINSCKSQNNYDIGWSDIEQKK